MSEGVQPLVAVRFSMYGYSLPSTDPCDTVNTAPVAPALRASLMWPCASLSLATLSPSVTGWRMPLGNEVPGLNT